MSDAMLTVTTTVRCGVDLCDARFLLSGKRRWRYMFDHRPRGWDVAPLNGRRAPRRSDPFLCPRHAGFRLERRTR